MNRFIYYFILFINYFFENDSLHVSLFAFYYLLLSTYVTADENYLFS